MDVFICCLFINVGEIMGKFCQFVLEFMLFEVFGEEAYRPLSGCVSIDGHVFPW